MPSATTRERLRLAAGEQRRAVRARGDADLDRRSARISLRAAPVGADLLDRDALADDRLLELVERELGTRCAALGVPVGVSGSAGVLRRATSSSTALVASWRSSLSSTWVASSSVAPCEPLICSSSASSTCGAVDLELLACRPSRRSSRCSCAELLDLAVRDVERVEDLGLGDLVGAGLDHQDRVLGAGDDQVEVGAGPRRGPPRSG